MTALPTRRDEAWRYSDLTALAEVWPQDIGETREITVASGETRSLTERLAGDGWRNDRVTVSVATGGRLDLSIVQARDVAAVTTQLYTIDVAAGASCQVDILQHGSRFGRIAVDVTMGDGADFELNGVNLARGTQTLEIVTTMRHAEPNGTSRQTVRIVADDRAIGNYLGKVMVARDAQKTDASQSVKALLLARTATANAKPELEIFADDVKCAHGATVGELNRDALFYMESRGVDPASAKALLTQAFIGDALDSVRDEAVREAMSAEAIAWLEKRI
ncbi:SufD family Fe-S cluster assembly protein [Glacieibacterium sp.]|uniref:SufD family Fe-S cluster assembly protein n=1 Tax=Glacieibacterium sp. TaxID=2860237 RepID=UPI003B00012F